MTMLEIEIEGKKHFIFTEHIELIKDAIVDDEAVALVQLSSGLQIGFKQEASKLVREIFPERFDEYPGEPQTVN